MWVLQSLFSSPSAVCMSFSKSPPLHETTTTTTSKPGIYTSQMASFETSSPPDAILQDGRRCILGLVPPQTIVIGLKKCKQARVFVFFLPRLFFSAGTAVNTVWRQARLCETNHILIQTVSGVCDSAAFFHGSIKMLFHIVDLVPDKKND